MPDESTKDDADEAASADSSGASDEDALQNAAAAMEEARRRIAEVPAEVVVTNHVMGLYELAAIHLSSEQPDLAAASLAIDAVASLVDGLGDRLGSDTPTMRDALANIRLAFVRVKSQHAAATSGTSESAGGPDGPQPEDAVPGGDPEDATADRPADPQDD